MSLTCRPAKHPHRHEQNSCHYASDLTSSDSRAARMTVHLSWDIWSFYYVIVISSCGPLVMSQSAMKPVLVSEHNPSCRQSSKGCLLVAGCCSAGLRVRLLCLVWSAVGDLYHSSSPDQYWLPTARLLLLLQICSLLLVCVLRVWAANSRRAAA